MLCTHYTIHGVHRCLPTTQMYFLNSKNIYWAASASEDFCFYVLYKYAYLFIVQLCVYSWLITLYFPVFGQAFESRCTRMTCLWYYCSVYTKSVLPISQERSSLLICRAACLLISCRWTVTSLISNVLHSTIQIELPRTLNQLSSLEPRLSYTPKRTLFCFAAVPCFFFSAPNLWRSSTNFDICSTVTRIYKIGSEIWAPPPQKKNWRTKH